jgi:membrane protease YdiL (CAAX protease family)
MKTDTTLQQRNRTGNKWFKWAPSSDIVLALATELWMIGVYYVMAHWQLTYLSVLVLFFFVTNLFINGLLPVWWIAYYHKQPLSELGITTRRWLLSLVISAVLAGVSLPRLLSMAAGTDWLPHVVANAVILWESLFVYGWLQLRFDRAFGIVPGVLLTGLCFAAYHIGGNYTPFALLMTLFAGLLYATAFRLTSNLLTAWPIAVSIGSSVGTLSGGLHFGWSQVAAWSVVLLIQLGFIGYTWWRQRKGEA